MRRQGTLAVILTLDPLIRLVEGTRSPLVPPRPVGPLRQVFDVPPHVNAAVLADPVLVALAPPRPLARAVPTRRQAARNGSPRPKYFDFRHGELRVPLDPHQHRGGPNPLPLFLPLSLSDLGLDGPVDHAGRPRERFPCHDLLPNLEHQLEWRDPRGMVVQSLPPPFRPALPRELVRRPSLDRCEPLVLFAQREVFQVRFALSDGKPNLHVGYRNGLVR